MDINNILIFCPDGLFRRGNVSFAEHIECVDLCSETVTPSKSDDILIPGLIDIHTHGILGSDHCDGTPDSLEQAARCYLSHGITSFLATTMTITMPELLTALENVGGYLNSRPGGGARLAGINAEGPFLSKEKRGAHDEKYLQMPNNEQWDEMNNAAQGGICLLSLAPELPGADDFIRHVKSTSANTHIAVAHTTADYDITIAAYEAGASHLTHTFNAMAPILHRAPGPIGAAADKGVWAELICDGFHVHPSVCRASFKMFPKRICLISDSSLITGMPDGDYIFGGLPVILKNGTALQPDGTIAGSTITVADGLRNAVRFGIPIEDAIAAATANPSLAIGMEDEIGFIKPGARADFILKPVVVHIEDMS